MLIVFSIAKKKCFVVYLLVFIKKTVEKKSAWLSTISNYPILKYNLLSDRMMQIIRWRIMRYWLPAKRYAVYCKRIEMLMDGACRTQRGYLYHHMW